MGNLRHWDCICEYCGNHISVTSDAMMMVCPSCEVTIDREGKIWHKKEVLGMTGVNFLSVGENIEDIRLELSVNGLHLEPEANIYAMVGKESRKLYGIVIKPVGGDSCKRRDIYFHDIDRMVKILEAMKE